MSNSSQVSFTLPTKNTDGSAITGAITAIVLIDTVNPPVKSFAVPAANIAAAVAGVVTVTFAQLGFTPVDGTDYFADVEVNAEGSTSVPSAIVSFTNVAVPNPATGFQVS